MKRARKGRRKGIQSNSAVRVTKIKPVNILSVNFRVPSLLVSKFTFI